ncbi:MAG: FliM/FliN family flagellar motor switch protein [Erythrobacter sp.]
MNLAQSFDHARPVAQHCAELISRGPHPEERDAALNAWRRDLAQGLSGELSAIFSGGKLSVTVSSGETISGVDVLARIGPVAANSLLRCGAEDRTALFSVDCATAVALTDLSFGGTGAVPDKAPEPLPRSASLTVEQVASAVARVLTRSSENCDDQGARSEVIVRSESAPRLKAFEPDAQCAVFILALSLGEGETWRTLVALPQKRLDDMLPGLGAGGSITPVDHQPSDGKSGPFAAISLPLTAVLSELDLSLKRLEELAPGDELPLKMPREVPLQIGKKQLALGQIGTFEDRMALRLTHALAQGDAK